MQSLAAGLGESKPHRGLWMVVSHPTTQALNEKIAYLKRGKDLRANDVVAQLKRPIVLRPDQHRSVPPVFHQQPHARIRRPKGIRLLRPSYESARKPVRRTMLAAGCQGVRS